MHPSPPGRWTFATTGENREKPATQQRWTTTQNRPTLSNQRGSQGGKEEEAQATLAYVAEGFGLPQATGRLKPSATTYSESRLGVRVITDPAAVKSSIGFPVRILFRDYQIDFLKGLNPAGHFEFRHLGPLFRVDTFDMIKDTPLNRFAEK